MAEILSRGSWVKQYLTFIEQHLHTEISKHLSRVWSYLLCSCWQHGFVFPACFARVILKSSWRDIVRVRPSVMEHVGSSVALQVSWHGPNWIGKTAAHIWYWPREIAQEWDIGITRYNRIQITGVISIAPDNRGHFYLEISSGIIVWVGNNIHSLCVGEILVHIKIAVVLFYFTYQRRIRYQSSISSIFQTIIWHIYIVRHVLSIATFSAEHRAHKVTCTGSNLTKGLQTHNAILKNHIALSC